MQRRQVTSQDTSGICLFAFHLLWLVVRVWTARVSETKEKETVAVVEARRKGGFMSKSKGVGGELKRRRIGGRGGS